MNIPDIVTPVIEFHEAERKSFPCHTNRASSMGYFTPALGGCIRRGVYARTNWQDAEPWDIESIIRFKEGDLQERKVLRDLSDSGIDIIEQQKSFDWKEYQISGHVDGLLLVDNKAVPLEIKSMSPFIFQQVHTFGDFKKYSWTTAYIAQIMLYMLMQESEHGLFLMKDKSSGWLRQINVTLDYELGEAIIQAAESINKHIANKTLPERIENRETCKKCPFKLLCLPDVDFGQELKIVDDPLFEKRLDEVLELRESKQVYDKEWKALTAEMKAQALADGGKLNMLVGKYRITADAEAKSFRPKVEII